MDGLQAPQTEYKRRKHARRRGEVLDAAASVFAAKGYFAATMQDIAARLGMRPGSLYHYLRSKEDALTEVCRISGHAYVETMKEIAAAPGPVAARIRRGIAAHMDDRWRDYLANFTLNRRNVPDTSVPEMQQIARDYLGLWAQLIAEGQRTGEIRGDLDPRIAAAGLVAMCNGVGGLSPKATPQPETGDRVFDLFMGGAAAA